MVQRGAIKEHEIKLLTSLVGGPGGCLRVRGEASSARAAGRQGASASPQAPRSPLPRSDRRKRALAAHGGGREGGAPALTGARLSAWRVLVRVFFSHHAFKNPHSKFKPRFKRDPRTTTCSRCARRCWRCARSSAPTSTPPSRRRPPRTTREARGGGSTPGPRPPAAGRWPLQASGLASPCPSTPFPATTGPSTDPSVAICRPCLVSFLRHTPRRSAPTAETRRAPPSHCRCRAQRPRDCGPAPAPAPLPSDPPVGPTPPPLPLPSCQPPPSGPPPSTVVWRSSPNCV
jgi:hypothetical protein